MHSTVRLIKAPKLCERENAFSKSVFKCERLTREFDNSPQTHIIGYKLQ